MNDRPPRPSPAVLARVSTRLRELHPKPFSTSFSKVFSTSFATLLPTLLCTLLWTVAPSAVAEDPVSAFTRPSTYESMKLSPDGTRVAVTRRTDAMEAITILDVDTLDVATSKDFGSRTRIDRFFWASDERLLVQPARQFPGRTDGFVPTGEIVGMNADGSDVEVLFGFGASRSGRTRQSGQEASGAAGILVDVLPDDPDHVVIQTLAYEFDGTYNEAYRMDVRSGRLLQLASSPLRDAGFLTDAGGEVALVLGTNDDARTEVWDLGGELPVRRNVEAEDAEAIRPVAPWPGVDGPSRFLVVENRLGDTWGLALWTPTTDELIGIARHPDVDVDDWLLDPDGRLYAVRFLDHRPSWVYPDPDHPLARLHLQLRAANPEDDVRIVSLSRDRARAIAVLHGPRRPAVYLLLDTRAPAVLRTLGTRPWHTRESLAPMEPIVVEARDGLPLRGYLTRPPGATEEPGPLVVLVHGGPHGVHDAWGFDPEVQLLAVHGYTVLQVNFRGSGGRGAGFERAGHGRWGAEMQDDLTDAVRWAVDAGVADPARICIAGASYGAYAALTGAFREPELFRCAIGLSGVYDLELMFERGDIRTAIKGQAFLERVLGDDTEALRARSPVHNADAIGAAVLLAHGDLDQRAPIEHAFRLRGALRRAGNAPEWIRERREGHGFLEEDNRRDYWARVLAFLDRHIGGAAAGPGR